MARSGQGARLAGRRVIRRLRVWCRQRAGSFGRIAMTVVRDPTPGQALVSGCATAYHDMQMRKLCALGVVVQSCVD
jgi:hypothetical protein